MNRRVVITGIGLISSIGNNCKEALRSLEKNRSGIEFMPEWKDMGLKSQVSGSIKNFNIEKTRKDFGLKSRYMDISSLYAITASDEAINSSGITKEDLCSERTVCIVGSGVSDTNPIYRASNRINKNNNGSDGNQSKGTPYDVTRCMSSSCSANLANYYGIKGRSFSITSACATSLLNVGYSYELILSNKCDLALAGGAEDASLIIAMLFDNMRFAISKAFNHIPNKASRPYDRQRDGFVMSGGGGIAVLEELEHAKARNAPIYAEIIGFGATSDGYDIIRPHVEGEGAFRCINQALASAHCRPDRVDYINTHGTSTPAGDLAEAKAIKRIFTDQKIPISSTKSLTGHGIGAAGIHELIFCILMLQENFISASINIEELDSKFEDLNIITKNREGRLNVILTNSFGFGGTNASMIIERFNQ
jgi:3-oxoacyl-[acyl-carrier-protein] synthase I